MLTVIMVLLLSTTILMISCMPQIGKQWQWNRSYASTHYQDGKFRNLVPTRLSVADRNMLKTFIEYVRGGRDRTPAEALPAVVPDLSERIETDAFRVTWLGHSTCLIEIDGSIILTDPMFSDRASPFSFLGPKRFATDLAIQIKDLPKIDTVLISHDHYDHLDYQSILALKEKVSCFYVPLGVGAHLKSWGVASHQIVEFDWWQQKNIGPLTFVATPTRHFSGRGLTDRNKTLWVSWVILGSRNRAFFGGDSGYFNGFKNIGETFGPFDITMLESGAYNEAWADIHMMPEQTVQAHLDLKGKVLLPIHWGKFSLSLHSWTEPVERLLAEAGMKGVTTLTPLMGQAVIPTAPREATRWWANAFRNRINQPEDGTQ